MTSQASVCHCRLILETEPQMVAARVSMRGADGEVPITEQVRMQTNLQNIVSILCGAFSAVD